MNDLIVLVKIAGSVLTVLYNTGAETNTNVDVWGQILIQLGLFPVLSASLAFIRKWLRTWETQDPRLTNYLRPMRLLQILILGGLICAIIGGTDMEPGSSDINTGYTLRRVGDFFFLIAVVAIFVSTLMLYKTSSDHTQRHDPQLTQIFFVLPISFVRVVYSTVQAFLSTPDNPGHNTWVYLVLLLVPDLVSVAIYTWFGLRLPPPGVKRVEGYTRSDADASMQGATKLSELGAIPKAYIQGGNIEAAQ